MKSFEQLARSGYAAYRQRQLDSGNGALAMQTPPWDQLTTPAQLDWIAVAKQIVAEMATVH